MWAPEDAVGVAGQLFAAEEEGEGVVGRLFAPEEDERVGFGREEGRRGEPGLLPQESEW